MLDREIFFQRQAEECRELARWAVNEDDRAFWQQTAERWEEQIRRFKQVPKVVRKDAARGKRMAGRAVVSGHLTDADDQQNDGDSVYG